MLRRFLRKISRKKTLADEELLKTDLSRCLNTFDLTFVGLGSLLGTGMYVILGLVVADYSGPATVISIFIAGFAAGLSAMCYAEMGSRLPRAGSSYLYTYVSMGEILAFVIGCCAMMSAVFGAASIMRGLLAEVDMLAKNDFEGIDILLFSSKHDFDIFSPIVVFAVCCILALGVNFFSKANKLCVSVNLVTIILFIVLAFWKADWKNWSEHGGFFPYGFSSVFQGASQIYYSFVGFQTIVAASEEAVNPQRSVPLSLFYAISFTTVVLIIVCIALSLSIPLNMIVTSASLPAALSYNGIRWGALVIFCGTMFALISSFLNTMFAIPRILYAISKDGLIFKYLARVNKTTKTPLAATLTGGVIAAVVAFFFDVTQLASIMSMASLTAYIFVSLSLIVLRYINYDPVKSIETSPLITSYYSGLNTQQFVCLATFLTFDVLTGLLLTFFAENGIIFIILLLMFCLGMILPITYLYICCPQNDYSGYIRIPLVPFLPALSIFINTCLILQFKALDCIRFLILIAGSVVIYFLYGIHNSELN